MLRRRYFNVSVNFILTALCSPFYEEPAEMLVLTGEQHQLHDVMVYIRNTSDYLLGNWRPQNRIQNSFDSWSPYMFSIYNLQSKKILADSLGIPYSRNNPSNNRIHGHHLHPNLHTCNL